MTEQNPEGEPSTRRPSRRAFLLGGAVAGVGATVAVGADLLLSGSDVSEPAPPAAEPDTNGTTVVTFHGTRQAGIEVAPQAHAALIALDLLDSVDSTRMRRLMELLTDDAARLTQGAASLANTEPELAANPARLTITFGFGPGFVARTGSAAPSWLRPLPAFSVDRLDPAFCDGDLLMVIASDDPVTVAHARRVLLKDSRSFATVRWSQLGFRRAYGTERPGTTMRNLFGQVDGTVNLEPGTEDFERLVWADAGWWANGTSLVLRRIHMNLDTWDELDRPGREQVVGRNLANGAPLTGVNEADEPDFDAMTATGFPAIATFSHVRRSRTSNPDERIFRRAYNYDDTADDSSVSNSGLIFASYQADVDAQFVPIQRQLDELDLLNQWTTPVGSAVFVIPPGCREGGFIGETLLA